jgi:hypothetical protein
MGIKINSSAIGREIRQEAGVDPFGKTPDELAEKIVPVLNVNPSKPVNIFKSSNKITTTGGSAAGYATPLTSDFYLHGFAISLAKNATCDLAEIYLDFTPMNQPSSFWYLETITGSGENNNVIVNFPQPILMKRGTNVNIVAGAFTAGAMNARLMVWGHQVGNTSVDAKV